MERRTLKTKSGDVLLEFIDGHWIVYPIQPTYWRKDPQALMVMAQESKTTPSEIDQSKLAFESFHIIDLSKGFEKGTFDLGRNRGYEEGEEPHRGEGPSKSDALLGPFGFSESDLYPFTDRRWTWLKKMIDEGLVENPNPGSWPTDRRSSKIWEAYYEDREEEDFDEEDLDEEDYDRVDPGWVPSAHGFAHSVVVKEPTRLFDLLFRWSDSGHRLVFNGNDESDEIKRFITEVFELVGESESLISSLDTLCNPRPIRILLPGLVEWTDMLIPWIETDGGFIDEDVPMYETADVPSPISLSEILLEWNLELGFCLICRRTNADWAWEQVEYERPIVDVGFIQAVTVKVSVTESTFSNRFKTGEELFNQLLSLTEEMRNECAYQMQFTDSKSNYYLEALDYIRHDIDELEEDEDEYDQDEFDDEEFDDVELDDEDEYEHDVDENYQPQKSLTSSRYRWSDVSVFLKTAFPEVYEDFKRALEKSNVS